MKINKIKNILFRSKRLIVVSDDGISKKDYTIFNRIVNFCFVSWFFYASFFYFKNQKIIEKRDNSIKELVSVNTELKNSIENIAGLLGNVRSYLYSLNLYDRFSGFETANFNKNINIINDSLTDSKLYNNILPVLARVDNETNNINNLLDSRISNIENLISNTGISENKIKNIYKVSYDNSGDLVSTKEYIVPKKSFVKRTNFDGINEKVNYLSYLESFVNSMPLTNPMNTYRITSNFGDRPDPFERNTRFHRGLDLAAPLNSKVVATANGTVIHAGNRGGYGNYVKIKHDNSITTEYAHLKNIAVKVGDSIKRGDVLGLQGNTGRSTGTHLHYEIRVDDEIKDPRNFINAGDKIF